MAGNDLNGDVVVLQDNAHVGFQSMIDSIMRTGTYHLERLNQRRRETCPVSDLVGWELFRLMLEVASRRKETCVEHLNLHNALTLFNPAPAT